MESAETFKVEVAYARPDVQVIIPVQVEPGTTIADAIRLSKIMEAFPEIDLDVNKVGVFGKLGKLDNPVRAGDRVEICRPLVADPKEVRRKRAAAGKKARKDEAP